MKAVCQALGVARSNVHALRGRSPSWVDRRTDRTPHGDEHLLADIREQIAELPSYGYRRACALVNRKRDSSGASRVNPKRVSRMMAGNALLLPKAPRLQQSSRAHTGTVSVQASDTRWCSDGFAIKCDAGQTVTATFAKDCCDREIMAFRAWERKGLPCEPVRNMLIEAVEKRFGAVEAVPAGHRLQFLSDNGGAYVAHETRHTPPGRWVSHFEHAHVQPPEQRHGRKLRQHVQARLRESDGPHRRDDSAGATACGVRALRRGSPALELEDEIAARVQAAVG
jgi:putative transposase